MALKAKGKAAAAGKVDTWVYVGPSITGPLGLQNGTIMVGTREQVLENHAALIAQRPAVKQLIVAAKALPKSRKEIRTPGTLLNHLYSKAAGK